MAGGKSAQPGAQTRAIPERYGPEILQSTLSTIIYRFTVLFKHLCLHVLERCQHSALCLMDSLRAHAFPGYVALNEASNPICII